MKTTPIQSQSRVRAADLPPEQLAGNSNVSEPEKIKELSRQFEAVLLRKILSDAQKTQFRSKYHEDSVAGGIYQDMVTDQLADSMSKSGCIGLGNQLSQQIARQHPSTSSLSKT